MPVVKIEPQRFPHGGGEAITVGVEAVPALRSAAQRVDRADGSGGCVNRHDFVHRENLVRHGEIEPVETLRMQCLQRLRQFCRRHIEAKIAPVGETRIIQGETRERGVVHQRAERVLNRVAEHGEGRAGKGPRREIAQGQHFGVLSDRFQRRSIETVARAARKSEIAPHPVIFTWSDARRPTRTPRRIRRTARLARHRRPSGSGSRDYGSSGTAPRAPGWGQGRWAADPCGWPAKAR